MKRSVIETVLGAVVLFLAGFFLIFSYRAAHVRKVSGYDITASFSGTGGLADGDDVRISGVRIGSINGLTLDQKNYLALVSMSIDPAVKLPDDTAAIISSDSLLGGRYLELQPGASDTMLKAGGRIQYTQAPQNLEALLGKFIFSMGSGKKDATAAGQAGGSADASTTAPAGGLSQATGQPPLSATPSASAPVTAKEPSKTPEPAVPAKESAASPAASPPDQSPDKAAADKAATEKVEQMQSQQLAAPAGQVSPTSSGTAPAATSVPPALQPADQTGSEAAPEPLQPETPGDAAPAAEEGDASTAAPTPDNSATPAPAGQAHP